MIKASLWTHPDRLFPCLSRTIISLTHVVVTNSAMHATAAAWPFGPTFPLLKRLESSLSKWGTTTRLL